MLSRQDAARIQGAALTADALVLRWFSDAEDDRLVLVNFGIDTHLTPIRNRCWRRRWTANGTCCGPAKIRATAVWGRPSADFLSHWHLRAESVVVLAARATVK